MELLDSPTPRRNPGLALTLCTSTFSWRWLLTKASTELLPPALPWSKKPSSYPGTAATEPLAPCSPPSSSSFSSSRSKVVIGKLSRIIRTRYLWLIRAASASAPFSSSGGAKPWATAPGWSRHAGTAFASTPTLRL